MIELHELEFGYDKGGFVLHVPRLSIARGETVANVGPSRSGRTTLLNLLAGILRPDRAGWGSRIWIWRRWTIVPRAIFVPPASG